MNKTRIAIRWFAGTLVASALVLGSTSVPAQARDTGWGPVGIIATNNGVAPMRDTGWGPV
jgi:hypothetical protein